MAIYHEDIANIELSSGSIHRSFLNHSIGSGDVAANRFGVRVMRNGEDVDLTGVSCFGYFRNAEGTNIALTSEGTVSGNVAYVTLPQACYNVEGQFALSIKLIGGGVTGTMRIVDGVVDNTNTGGAVAPTGDVPTYQEIIAQYDAMVAATAAANASIADTFDATKKYSAGKYVINSGKLYRLTADHAANVTWTNTSKVAVNFGDDLSETKNTIVRSEMTEKSYGIVLPYEMMQFLNQNLVNGVYDTGAMKYADSSTRLTVPFVIRSKTKFLLQVISGYEIARSLLNNEMLDSYNANSGWVSAVTVYPDTYIVINVRRTDNAAISPSEAPLVVANMERYAEPIDFAIGNASNIKAIAHRGYTYGAPENTIPAFRMAVDRGFRHIESDVVFTSDGVPVMLHDSTIDRTSNGTGSVISMTYDDLLQYDFGSWFSADYAGTKIPTFQEYIHFCRLAQVKPYIEIKTENAGTMDADLLVNTLIEIVRSEGMIDNVYWTSYGNGYLRRIYNALPNAKLVYLTAASSLSTAISTLRSDFPTASIQLLASEATTQVINTLEEAKIPLTVAVLDTESEIVNADKYISGILSNKIVASTLLYDYALHRM